MRIYEVGDKVLTSDDKVVEVIDVMKVENPSTNQEDYIYRTKGADGEKAYFSRSVRNLPRDQREKPYNAESVTTLPPAK